MAESSGHGMQWLKYGCFGCLGIVGIFVLVVAGSLGIAYLQVQSENVETRGLDQELPERVPVATPQPSGATSIEASGYDLSEPGRVVLDLQNGEMILEPGPAGDPIRVEAEYDTKSFELEGNLERYGETGWIYRVHFARTSSGLLSGLRGMLGGATPKVRVLLPRGVPFSLEGRISEGQSRTELGGLWLTSADLEISKGDHRISFEEPLLLPMDRFEVTSAMGGMEIRSLGNASPSAVEIDHSMGGMFLDLRGSWARDASIDASFSMGGAEVVVPEGVHVIGLENLTADMGEIETSGFADRPEPGEGAVTLSFSISASMGGVLIEG